MRKDDEMIASEIYCKRSRHDPTLREEWRETSRRHDPALNSIQKEDDSENLSI